MAEFKKGDRVQLKCGGPAMVVETVESDSQLWCVWIAANKKHGERFDSETLQIYQASAPSVVNISRR